MAERCDICGGANHPSVTYDPEWGTRVWIVRDAVPAEPKVEPWMEELATKFDESPAAGGRHDKLVKLIARAYAERKK